MIRLAVRCRPESAERVLAELLELVPGGVEEERGRSYVEYAIYGAPGELPELPDLRAATGAELVEIETEEIPDDWGDSWRDFHRPVVVADRLVVRPSWCDHDAIGAADLVEIVIDPGRAFGTGAHATTTLCLELLLELEASGAARGALADWGTGSGVLAIAAARLGWAPVTACDHERSALDAAGENARANGVELELARVNLREEPPPWAPTVTANLTAPVLRAAATRMTRLPERLVCSGLLRKEADSIARELARHGLTERSRLGSGEWSALLLTGDA